METRLLVAVSEKHDNLFGARFLGDFFTHKKKMKVTLLYLTAKPLERFNTDPEGELRVKKSETTGQKALDEAKKALLKLGFKGGQISTKLRPRRLSKVDEIIREGSQGKYDAVVLGRRGLSRLEQTFDVSITSALFQQEWDFPVWFCRKPEPERKHVLACVNGSDASRRMLDHVGFVLGQAQNQNVTMLTICRNGDVSEKAAKDILLRSKETLVSDGISSERIRVKVIPEANVGKAIIEEAGAKHFAAVAVGRTGKGVGVLKKPFPNSVGRTLFQELEGASLWLA